MPNVTNTLSGSLSSAFASNTTLQTFPMFPQASHVLSTYAWTWQGKELVITVPYSNANLAFDFGNTIGAAAYFRGENIVQISTTPVANADPDLSLLQNMDQRIQNTYIPANRLVHYIDEVLRSYASNVCDPNLPCTIPIVL